MQGANYLVTHNTDRDSLYATGLPMQELCRIIMKFPKIGWNPLKLSLK